MKSKLSPEIDARSKPAKMASRDSGSSPRFEPTTSTRPPAPESRLGCATTSLTASSSCLGSGDIGSAFFSGATGASLPAKWLGSVPLATATTAVGAATGSSLAAGPVLGATSCAPGSSGSAVSVVVRADLDVLTSAVTVSPALGASVSAVVKGSVTVLVARTSGSSRSRSSKVGTSG